MHGGPTIKQSSCKAAYPNTWTNFTRCEPFSIHRATPLPAINLRAFQFLACKSHGDPEPVVDYAESSVTRALLTRSRQAATECQIITSAKSARTGACLLLQNVTSIFRNSTQLKREHRAAYGLDNNDGGAGTAWPYSRRECIVDLATIVAAYWKWRSPGLLGGFARLCPWRTACNGRRETPQSDWICSRRVSDRGDDRHDIFRDHIAGSALSVCARCYCE